MLAQEIVQRFVLRWNVEVTFEEVRAHLGVETQRQWTDKAIGRTTPILMGLYSLVCLIAHQARQAINLQPAWAAWYDKGDQGECQNFCVQGAGRLVQGGAPFDLVGKVFFQLYRTAGFSEFDQAAIQLLDSIARARSLKGQSRV